VNTAFPRRESTTSNCCTSRPLTSGYFIFRILINSFCRCRNFERLEGRLSGIEGELSWLTALLKTSGIQKDASSSPSEDGSGDENNSPVADEQGRCSLGKAASNRHVVRSPDNLGDQYYGPGTLLSLCYNLKDTVLSKQGTEQHPSNEDTSRGEVGDSVVSAVTGRKAELVSRICSLASPGNFEPTVDTPEEMEIRLPPKQLLLMVLPQFLSQLNYTIDLFVESHLQQNIEHVYSRPPTTANDAWAICFNTIILLVLDSESANAGNAPLMASQYSLPFFHAMRAALHHAHLLTTPRLINVQALALLVCSLELPPSHLLSLTWNRALQHSVTTPLTKRPLFLLKRVFSQD
jgi:hypothetical protein